MRSHFFLRLGPPWNYFSSLSPKIKLFPLNLTFSGKTPSRQRRKVEENAGQLFSKANTLYVDEKYKESADLFTQAINTSSATPYWYYFHRAAAYIQLKNYEAALRDAEVGLQMCPGSVTGRKRKGIAMFHQNRFKEAKAAFEDAKRLGHKSVNLWIRKCEAEINGGIASGDVKSTPQVRKTARSSNNIPASAPPKIISKEGKSHPPASTPSRPPSVPEAPTSSPIPTSVPKYREGWYQSNKNVMFTMYARGLKPEHVRVVFTVSECTITVKSNGPDYTRTILLAKGIVPLKSKYSLSPYKLEITLAKASDENWPALERKAISTVQKPVPSPSSTRKSPYVSGTDWDAVSKKIDKELDQEKPEGEAALHALFQKIYKNATPETRRAMNKSYQVTGKKMRNILSCIPKYTHVYLRI
ncbi:hypothetical protein AAMO2058_000783600 [Amorphochlora amoebiformis]